MKAADMKQIENWCEEVVTVLAEGYSLNDPYAFIRSPRRWPTLEELGERLNDLEEKIDKILEAVDAE